MTKITNAALKISGNTTPTTDNVVRRDYWLQFVNYGTRFVWVANSQVKLSPSGHDGKARAVLWDGSTLKGFLITADVTADITSSGANGLDTGAEAASTFYYVWGIGKSDGTFALLLSVSATSPTMPSGYTFKKLLWGVANDGSSNFATFDHMHDGKCLYTVVQQLTTRGINVLISGTATTATAVSMVKAAPDIVGVALGLLIRGVNSNATNSLFVVSEDSGQTVQIFTSRTIGATGVVNSTEHWDSIVCRNTGSLATSLYYKWGTSTANLDAGAFVQWWNLDTRW